jgi:hypothetical protein
MMSSTSKNLTKIPIVTGYDDPSPCHSSNDRCTSCGDVDTFGGTMSCPSCSQPFCPKCFLPTQHEPCCRSACLAPILLSTVVLLRRWQHSSCVMQCCTTTHTSTSAQRTTSSPTALPKSPLHNSGSKCTISCSTFELQLVYLTLKDRGCNPLYYSITTAASQLHQPGDISVRWLYTLLVKQ